MEPMDLMVRMQQDLQALDRSFAATHERLRQEAATTLESAQKVLVASAEERHHSQEKTSSSLKEFVTVQNTRSDGVKEKTAAAQAQLAALEKEKAANSLLLAQLKSKQR